ncbi:Multidrug resistance protein MdtC [Dyadobacter sp. CECT 9275]|jgi:multidrug efflux pump subunit AcrB|uniref:Multidrug resistance protein MdtC n=1 Tax=Dyadobacter helix TaxID=2822344 RepID=A0A916N7X7_9BACT|nr:efflux RND transporter permease subunit [Dyadobacter sp. CECT 9275]CAG5010923.1 Multidrug resistance protein MdtC [Dyadobacter sp. CECT 9275]
MLQLIRFALRKPVFIVVAIVGMLFFSILAIRKLPIDIFPKMGTPTIYVAQTYGGLSPQQMEGFLASYYEYHFLYITGIKFVESKSVQGVSLIKLQFHEGTDMATAMAETISYVNRARSFMPAGTFPPFVMRYDAGSLPVGQLVFSSATRSLNEIQDLALFKVRPMFGALPGVSAPPPLGGNQRTILIKANPERLRSYNISPDELVASIAKNNVLLPAGNVRIGDQTLITPSNSVVDNFKELEQIAVKEVNGTSVFVRDVASVENGADITSGYALINGKRSIYIPVTKRADASTWDVVQRIKENLPQMQAAIPDDIKVSYEFDQSGYVINSLKSLLFEGGLGAILTGLVVLLFLRDVRSALIVVLTIPLALLAAVVGLYLAGHTINMMTLGGLALAVGILVDEATVTIENIHRHQQMSKSTSRAILDACLEIAAPKLLILLSVLVVFLPAIFMTGVPKAMFIPLSLSVGFAMTASFLLSQTLVPILANWLLKNETATKSESSFDRFSEKYGKTVMHFGAIKFIAPLITLLFVGTTVLLYNASGRDIFPKIDGGQFQLRLRMPTGTRIERTEDATKKILGLINSLAGKENIAITSCFVGLQPSTYAINSIFLWTSGPHEALLKVNLLKGSAINIETLKEQIRDKVVNEIPNAVISFEPADLVDQVMSQGSNTPVEVLVQGKDLTQGRVFAERLKSQMKRIGFLRDVQIGIPLDYPSIQINYDRVRMGQMGLSIEQAGKAVTAAVSSSRNTQPVYWLDKAGGNSFQVQVEYPQYMMNSPEQIEQIPISSDKGDNLYLRDIADWKKTISVGEYDRMNQQRFITITANIYNQDLGEAVTHVNQAISKLGEQPHGMKVYMRGQSDLLTQTLRELSIGLLLAVTVIFLMLSAYFQSLRIPMIVLSVIPAVVTGSLLLLFVAGHSLNIQSFMGCIMAIGVSVANVILLVTNAEAIRKQRLSGQDIGIQAAKTRLRPILMTAIAMVAGMIPMAMGVGEGGQQTAPLGVAVIGGLIFSTLSTLLITPLIYNAWIGNKNYVGVSLDPDDNESKNFGQ